MRYPTKSAIFLVVNAVIVLSCAYFALAYIADPAIGLTIAGVLFLQALSVALFVVWYGQEAEQLSIKKVEAEGRAYGLYEPNDLHTRAQRRVEPTISESFKKRYGD